jgi:hypothetical protein
VSQALLNPFLWFALLLAAWGAWRLAGWAASGDRLPLRDRRETATGFTTAGLSAEAFYAPGAKQAIEAIRDEAVQREEDDAGGPPRPEQRPA